MKHDIAEEAGAWSSAADGIFSRQSWMISAPDWGGVMCRLQNGVERLQKPENWCWCVEMIMGTLEERRNIYMRTLSGCCVQLATIRSWSIKHWIYIYSVVCSLLQIKLKGWDSQTARTRHYYKLKYTNEMYRSITSLNGLFNLTTINKWMVWWQ